MSDLGSQAPIDAVYTERNQAVAVLVVLAQRLGYPTGVYAGDDPDWPVVFVELPSYGAGQVSWHIPLAEAARYFPRIPALERNPWDGHDNAEKARRLMTEAQAGA